MALRLGAARSRLAAAEVVCVCVNSGRSSSSFVADGLIATSGVGWQHAAVAAGPEMRPAGGQCGTAPCAAAAVQCCKPQAHMPGARRIEEKASGSTQCTRVRPRATLARRPAREAAGGWRWGVAARRACSLMPAKHTTPSARLVSLHHSARTCDNRAPAHNAQLMCGSHRSLVHSHHMHLRQQKQRQPARQHAQRSHDMARDATWLRARCCQQH